jgi:hypothetical protein
MPTSVFVLIGLAVAGFIAWAVTSTVRQSRARKAALDRLGFTPCPDRKAWLEERITRMEANAGDRYEVGEPRRLPGDPEIYYYVKTRHGSGDESAFAEEEILFPLERASTGPLRLVVKPSSIPSGLAARMLGSIAKMPARGRSDGLQGLELPRDRSDKNLVAALGPVGASLYDLVDGSTLGVLEGLGDAGALFVNVRDGWCGVASPTSQVPFRVDQIVARIRPILMKS